MSLNSWNASLRKYSSVVHEQTSSLALKASYDRFKKSGAMRVRAGMSPTHHLAQSLAPASRAFHFPSQLVVGRLPQSWPAKRLPPTGQIAEINPKSSSGAPPPVSALEPIAASLAIGQW